MLVFSCYPNFTCCIICFQANLGLPKYINPGSQNCIFDFTWEMAAACHPKQLQCRIIGELVLSWLQCSCRHGYSVHVGMVTVSNRPGFPVTGNMILGIPGPNPDWIRPNLRIPGLDLDQIPLPVDY